MSQHWRSFRCYFVAEHPLKLTPLILTCGIMYLWVLVSNAGCAPMLRHVLFVFVPRSGLPGRES